MVQQFEIFAPCQQDCCLAPFALSFQRLFCLLENRSFVDFPFITLFSDFSRNTSEPKSPDHTINPQRCKAPRLCVRAGFGPGRHLISPGQVSGRASELPGRASGMSAFGTNLPCVVPFSDGLARSWERAVSREGAGCRTRASALSTSCPKFLSPGVLVLAGPGSEGTGDATQCHHSPTVRASFPEKYNPRSSPKCCLAFLMLTALRYRL